VLCSLTCGVFLRRYYCCRGEMCRISSMYIGSTIVVNVCCGVDVVV
jgi:hypothetical protein